MCGKELWVCWVSMWTLLLSRYVLCRRRLLMWWDFYLRDTGLLLVLSRWTSSRTCATAARMRHLLFWVTCQGVEKRIKSLLIGENWLRLVLIRLFLVLLLLYNLPDGDVNLISCIYGLSNVYCLSHEIYRVFKDVSILLEFWCPGSSFPKLHILQKVKRRPGSRLSSGRVICIMSVPTYLCLAGCQSVLFRSSTSQYFNFRLWHSALVKNYREAPKSTWSHGPALWNVTHSNSRS